ncbi:RelA/SpoT domain-containing protein [Providencia manganoxydans]|uniref:RelA/SpoT domain-containing protein n=1 Tax=Providencia manganoxydans TaxID=2923283 RepID=UPI0034E4AD3A
MANEQYEKGKIKLSYSKKQVKRAGDNIRKNIETANSVDIIRNFRAAHLYPLMIIKNLVWKHAKKKAPTAIIARRLKRLPTIIDKLSRATLNGKQDNSISIVRMQDIGGCRVIVENREQLISLNNSLNNSRTVHSIKKINDYTVHKKATGYRGIHRVYQCYGNEEYHDWKGFLIEVQLRTKLQHLWATTIEVVDLCEGKSLKTNPFNADKDWIEFFQIMSDFLADDDGFCYLDRTTKEEHKKRILELDKKLTATDKLLSFNRVFSDDNLKKEYVKHRYVVLSIDMMTTTVACTFFTNKESALNVYSQIEDETRYNGLFVEIDDIKNLQKAYPNYIIDTSFFVRKFEYYTSRLY